jgi:hypothetical protein
MSAGTCLALEDSQGLLIYTGFALIFFTRTGSEAHHSDLECLRIESRLIEKTGFDGLPRWEHRVANSSVINN